MNTLIFVISAEKRKELLLRVLHFTEFIIIH